jgi:Flp pilus assembly protein TadB
MTGVVLLTGVGTGLGLWLILLGLFPRPPHLATALDDPRTPPAAGPGAPETERGWRARWSRPAVTGLRRLGLPTPATCRDLATLDKPVEVHLAEQATTTVVGLLLGPVVGVVLAAAGTGPGLIVPAAGSLLLGAAGFAAPMLALRRDARRYRATFRDGLSSFLDLVVISLASGSGVDQALDEAAAVGTGEAFREVRYALTEARLARVPPWETLARLGARLGVPQLQQLAAALGLSGTEGAKIRQTLRSRAVALRQQQLTTAEGEANAATERMAMPVVALFTGFLIFLGYPAVVAVLTGL